MAKKKCRECPPDAPLWLITFGDLNTLLLTFFVMILSSNTSVDTSRMQLILSAFTGSLGIFDGGQTFSKGQLEEMGMNLESMPAMTKGQVLSKAFQNAKERFKSKQWAQRVVIAQDERGVVISLVDIENFNPGSAILQPPIMEALDTIGPMLKETPNFIRIEGHSEHEIAAPYNQSSKERQYINAWDLAGARSLNVLNYLTYKHHVAPESLSSVSFGSYRPLPVEKELQGTPEGKAVHRRVDIIILANKTFRRSKEEQNTGLPDSLIPGSEYKEETE